MPLGKNGEVQLTDALRMLSKKEAMYAYDFDGVRYDVGDKLGFLKATVDFALKRPNLQNDFIQYLREVCDKSDNMSSKSQKQKKRNKIIALFIVLTLVVSSMTALLSVIASML